MKHLVLLFQFIILSSWCLSHLFAQNLELDGIAGKSGVVINNPGVDGIVINNAVDDGLVISAADIGAFIQGDYQSAFFSSSGVHDEGAIYIANGNTAFPDIELNGGVMRSFAGFNMQLDRFNSGTNHLFQVTHQGTQLFTLNETATATFSDFMTIHSLNSRVTLGSSGSTIIEIEEIGSGNDRTAQLVLQHATNGDAIIMNAAGSANEPFIHMMRADNTVGIELDVDNNGDSRIVTDELEIKGGSDLAENFKISEDPRLIPGTVVSIDPSTAGQLTISDSPYDKKVAGIISGAKGIQSGMIMGQSETIADGDFPVALVGRVYARADATHSEIKPGDLLTTSKTPGHLMKVSRYKKAKGAIVGKAMTGLKEGTGYVLVLVNLQ